MPFKKINIEKFCNHKLIFENLPVQEERFGIDNICVLKENFEISKKLKKGDLEIDYSLGRNDNIICNSQRIKINQRVKRLHMVGFAYWGDACENLKIIYEDNTECWIELTFIDWSCSYKSRLTEGHDPENQKMIEDIQVMISSGEWIHLIYFHDFICELNEQKAVKEIILPDNILIHIFAITAEY